MTKFTTSAFLATGLALALGTAAQGQVLTANWTGGGNDGDYNNPLNWDDGEIPVGGSIQNINGNFVVVRDASGSNAGVTTVNDGAVLNVTGGTHADGRSGNTTRNLVGSSGVSTVNVSGADTIYNIGHILVLGGNNTTSAGTFNQTDGLVSIFRGGNEINNSNLPSTSLDLGSNTAGALTSTYEISGGAFETRVGAGIASSGVFSVVGSDATSIGIGSNGNGDGFLSVNTGGTLRFAFDEAGITPIFVDDVDGDGDVFVDFADGAILDLSFADFPLPTQTTTYTLLEAENTDIADLGLQLSASSVEGFTFNVDNSGDNGVLTATFTVVPEPASFALLAVGGFLALGRRRK